MLIRIMVILLLLPLGGCCRVARPGPVLSAEELVEFLRHAARPLPEVRGELRVDHVGPDGRVAGKVYVFAASGGRLRFEAVSPLDTPLRTIAVDGDRFSLVDRESRRCWLGPAEPCLLGQSLGLELAPAHVAAALLGAVPVLNHREAEARWDSCGYYELRLEGEDDGWRQVIHVAPDQGHWVAILTHVEGPDGRVLEMELSRHRQKGSVFLPQRLFIRMPRTESSMRVQWRETDVGVNLPSRAWRAACPEGFAVEQPQCGPSRPLPFEPREQAAPPPAEPADGPPEPSESDLMEELGL